MKLLYCPICKDVLRLHVSDAPRHCLCGRSWGRYLSPGRAEVGGRAMLLGIRNLSLLRAVQAHPQAQEKLPIDAFLFPPRAESPAVPVADDAE